MEKHIKVLYGLLIVGFLSISIQLWLQTQAINDLNSKMESVNSKMESVRSKMESVRELLFRFA